ncbi:hypothetical protein P154DRAFT_213185 [Amniculicola lignicola CBS 123094]|uniref:Uncharacterized protein n=1 Tax=Amniculicola lignicola CBS 123094 TaxID=1392246 RepID=A0A6A5WKX2_9PLEO|nr:hypothetical protein P154DRAFT_213185 [Amniculicola lignicola CBS 123094]
MAPESGTDPIPVGGTRPPFPQTGSWNMLDVAKLPYESSMGILARYMAGRVNPYTGGVVEQLSRQFRLAPKGRRNTELAISSLKIVSSVGNVLEFGFGIEDVIRVLLKTEAGTVGLVLCAALKECYHNDVAIEVLMEMARLCNVGGEFMPPSSAWRDWFNACAGVLAATDFPQQAEHLMRLPNPNQRLGVYQRLVDLPKSLRSCSSPKSIADALCALGSITRDELEAVTFIGGADAGWLAAVAEWFFDLRVTMVMDDGEVFYTNHADPDNVQVKIVFQDSVEQPSPSLQCVGRSYILTDMSKLLDGNHTPSAGVVSGRLDWKQSLTCTFQSDFEALMKIPITFGELLGSASRIFKALAQAQTSFPDSIKLACTSYGDSSFGPGLVINILKWFPELKPLKTHMQKASRSDVKNAQKTYEFCISKIRQHCGCRTCQSTSTGFDSTDEKTEMSPGPSPTLSTTQDEMLTDSGSHRSLDTDPEDDWDPDQYCQVLIAETIIYLSRALSTVCLESDTLLPMRSGFEQAYSRQLDQRRSANCAQSAIKTLGQIAFCLDFDNNFSISMQDGKEEAVEIRLHSVLELFSGQRASSSSMSLSAASSNGIVAFLGVLREPSTDRNAVARIHVIPGRIYHEKKRYKTLVDRVLAKEPVSDFAEAEKFAGSGEDFQQTTLGVRESAYALQCLLGFGPQQNPSDASLRPSVIVGPSLLAAVLASRRGLVSCKWTRDAYCGKSPKGPSCVNNRNTSLLSQDEAQKAWENTPCHVQVQDKTITILRPTNDATALAAIASAAYLHPMCSLYIVSSECLQCCVETVIGIDRPERSRFCFLYLPYE